MDAKNLRNVDLEKLIDEMLNDMYKNYDYDVVGDGDTPKIVKFNKIWDEKFVKNINPSSGDFDKDENNKYKNPIIQTVYDKFRCFYLEDCPKIKEKIDEIKSDVDDILNEKK